MASSRALLSSLTTRRLITARCSATANGSIWKSNHVVGSVTSTGRVVVRMFSAPPPSPKEEDEASLTTLEELKKTSPALADALKQNNDDDLYKPTDSYPDYEGDKNEVQLMVEQMHKEDSHLVWKSSMLPDADPHIPDTPSEVAATDPAHSTWSEGHARRTVYIRQKHKRQNQAPVQTEQDWIINFMDDGQTSQIGTKWSNPLMGWKSGADPMASMTLQMTFDNAKEAVYFAKKRGWDYVVDEPRYRTMRKDGATYQDNFLPQAIAYEVMANGTKCNVWERSKAGTSHYFRPLTYHGTGPCQQHGPNGNAPIAEAPEGYYKMR